MKKKILYVVLMLGFSLKGLGQVAPTYSLTVNYRKILPDKGDIICDGGSANITTDSESLDYNYDVNTTYDNVMLSNSFELNFYNSCTALVFDSNFYCGPRDRDRISASELIKWGSGGSWGCTGSIAITDFKPNVSITNQKSTTVCSGEELILQGLPANFPKEAYHWQYSFDGVTNWVDVSNKIGTRELNNTEVTRFSIYEILGNDHINHFDKPIYFRLGYSQDRLGYGENRPFTEPLAITYSSCAPIEKGLTYVGPNCNNDAIQTLEVAFNRNLLPNENIFPIYVSDKTDPTVTTPLMQETTPVTSLKYDATTGLYKFSFTTINKLINSHVYEIKYQARMNTTPRGVLKTTGSFTYTMPVALKFEIKKEDITEPTCSGGEDGSIKINVISGVAPYRFYQDNTLITPVKIDNQHYIIKGLKANSNGYKIKVTDTNGCIEKTS